MNENNSNQTSAPAIDLSSLGWRPFFTRQLDADELETCVPVRVVAVHRSELHVIGSGIEAAVPPLRSDLEEDRATIGDWLLLDKDSHRIVRRLDRLSLFKRRAPGTGRSVQLIAANVDTMMIVSSCNEDFNIARLERYLAVARDADVTPVIVLTKADLTETADDYRRQAEALMPLLVVETLDATDPTQTKVLNAWCGPGQTLAFVGSSGVGKSTLTNTLLGNADIATQAIREDDAKGRHTTTHRAMYQLPLGGWVIDTPGIRELQLTDVSEGIADLFGDIEELVANCRFHDCQHDTEPGCAIREAIDIGVLEEDRYRRWCKLNAENERNSQTIAQARAKDKSFTKMVKQTMKGKPSR